MQANDPEREFQDHLCRSGEDGCAGDVRLYDWQTNGYGIVRPVLFTARNGATLSGHVWATRSGRTYRPGVVITNGSVQADEQLYWFVAQTLAKAGYVVLTFDPQGQGQSDTPVRTPTGRGRARPERRPPVLRRHRGRDRLLPVDAEQALRAREELPTGTPRGQAGPAGPGRSRRRIQPVLVDARTASRLGLAGHSYGAAGVSYIGQWDPRVRAVVAWDNLGPDPNGRAAVRTGAALPGGPANRAACRSPSRRSACRPTTGCRRRRTPSDPDPQAKAPQSRPTATRASTRASSIIRGGTHLDFGWIPNPAFGATLRGADLIDWYTTAWFDKYVKGDARADRRLLTDRWCDDASEAAVDPDGDGNMFSLLLPLAAGHRPGRRHAVRLRGPARRVPRHASRMTGSRRTTPTSRSTQRSTRGRSRRTLRRGPGSTSTRLSSRSGFPEPIAPARACRAPDPGPGRSPWNEASSGAQPRQR